MTATTPFVRRYSDTILQPSPQSVSARDICPNTRQIAQPRLTHIGIPHNGNSTPSAPPRITHDRTA